MTPAPFPAPRHDHDRCIDAALTKAEHVCQARGARMTAIRQTVLRLIWAEHRPIGAYQILEALRSDGRNAQPPTVYRALEFLSACGLIHRIESLNAYVGCSHPDQPHQGQFLICRQCRRTAEVMDEGLDVALSGAANRAGFTVEARTLEAVGLCPDCRPDHG